MFLSEVAVSSDLVPDVVEGDDADRRGEGCKDRPE